MADNKSGTGKGAPQSGTGKRPYATLDLKATEIKVTPVAGKQPGAGSASAASSSGSAPAAAPEPDVEAPRPAAARTYAMPASATREPQTDGEVQTASKAEKPKGASSASASVSASADTLKEPKSSGRGFGGLAGHLAAGVAGGVIALAATQWVLPGLDRNEVSRLAGDTTALSQRLSALESSEQRNVSAADIKAIENRIGDLEKTAETIPALTERQRQLVAETKAALASAASDSGSTQLIERLGKVEDRLKALADAGANDPNPGRVEQFAAITGKVSDLQTGLEAQLESLRASVAKDVDTRVQAVTQLSEAARADTQTLNSDVASMKSGFARLEETARAAKTSSERVAADLKVVQEETAQLKTAVDGLKETAAKPADITAAVTPIAERTAALEKSVQDVVQADAARRESAEHVVLAIELQNLKRAIDSGRNYAAELARVKLVAGGRVDLGALEALQDRGVPSLVDLNAAFRVAAERAIDADLPQPTGVVDRLWAEAKSIVRVRRIDLKPDDKSAEATTGRMQVALTDGRLGDVLEAAKDLSPAAQAAAQPFLDQVAARVGVDRALENLESQLKASIAGGAQPASKPLP